MEKLAKGLGLFFGKYLVGKLGHKIIVLIIAMLPVLELRGSIIVAKLFKLDMTSAIIFSLIGNILPIPFVLLLFKKVLEWLRKYKIFNKIVKFFEGKVYNNQAKIERWQFWGLVLFVAIPLPGTGAWTGAMAASVLQMDLKKSFLAITLGVLIAAVIVTFLTYGVFANIL